MSFEARCNFSQRKIVQIDNINDELKKKLYKCYLNLLKEFTRFNLMSDIANTLGYCSSDVEDVCEKEIRRRFFSKSDNCKWYDPYCIIEYTLECLKWNFPCKLKCRNCKNSVNCKILIRLQEHVSQINQVLEEEVSGYRLIDGIFVPITNCFEIFSINESLRTQGPVGIHFEKALKLLSSAENRDYENSIKESITAVESMCCIIIGQNEPLGVALKKLEDYGVVIHSALKGAFSKLYGYTSDAGGIRHGSMNFQNASSEDAKYMLVSCSAFVNYLQEKLSKMEGQIDGQNET